MTYFIVNSSRHLGKKLNQSYKNHPETRKSETLFNKCSVTFTTIADTEFKRKENYKPIYLTYVNEMMNTLDFTKSRKLCSSKYTIEEMER